MATVHDDDALHPRPIDRWFDSYSGDHRNAINQRIHVIAVPAILWSVIALLWCIPVPPGGWFRPGVFAGLAMVAAGMFYFRASRVLGLWMLGVFVVAWIAQFIGHKYEGRKPSFLTDLTYLLIGPAWVVAKGLRKLGIAW